MSGPHYRFAPLLSRTLRRIPQAVGVVATYYVTSISIPITIVSILQAVATIASSPLFYLLFVQALEMGGPHRRFAPLLSRTLRRIPQAVGVVATKSSRCTKAQCVSSFNTASGKYYCFITFVLPSLRLGKRWADLIVALLLCCLAPFGAYHKR